MGHGRRIGVRLLILILASLALPGLGTSLNAFAGGPAGTDLPAAGRAGSETGSAALGVVRGDLSAHLNNQPVVPGMAVFKGDVIQTSRTSGAAVNFRSGESALLAESSEVALEWETSRTSLNLRQGVLVVHGSPESARPTSVHVLGATVIVQGEGGFPGICRIAALGRGAAVFNVHGHVEIHGEGLPFVLPVGKSANLDTRWAADPAGGPQAAGQPAGKVSRKLPEATVQHSGQTTSTVLKIEDPIYWEDLIQTVQNGRIQIQLLDGSTLNVGARSQLRVTKHDVASGQTAIEMTVGKMRADVVKITKPGGSFQVKTQTAVIGVVGTRFIINAALNNTHVICLDGEVIVSSVNPVIAGAVTLHAGQVTNVPRGGPPGAAAQAPSGQMNSNISQTNISGAVEGVGGVSGLGGTVGNAVNASAAGASAAAAGVSGLAIAREHSASHTLDLALTDLSFTGSTSSSATSNANSATAAANSAGSTINSITQQVLSPSTPCGCQ